MFDAEDTQSHSSSCACTACASQAQLKTDESGEVSENYVIYGGKWGDSGTMGTWGGIVSWSLVGAGVSDGTGGQFFTGTTVDMDAYFNFDYVAVLEAAFDAWSQVANIEFIQVADDNATIGYGTAAEIRVSAAYMDGPSSTLAAAYLPNGAGTGSQSALVGDMNFDSGETYFWNASSFFLVAVHEIGHALGLRHEATDLAIMNPYYNSSLSGLQADDIAGIQAIYGVQDNAPSTYVFTSARTDLELLSGIEGLTVQGNALDNAISGAGVSETLLGAGGSDTLRGNGGDDTLIGDTRSSHVPGISLGSGSVTKNASTGNASLASALDVSADFSLAANADIASATVTPHVSIVAQGSNQIDWYKVTIGADTATLTLDIDYGVNSGGSVDTVVTLYDTDGTTILARTDYGPTSSGAGGSTSQWDAFISQSVSGAGTYYISVGEWTGGSYGSSTQGNVDTGDTYTLQISVDGDLPSTGSDILDGGAGRDLLIGGAGADLLTGGADGDTFAFKAADFTAAVTDTITDFQSGLDTIVLDGFGVRDVSFARDGGSAEVTLGGNGAIALSGAAPDLVMLYLAGLQDIDFDAGTVVSGSIMELDIADTKSWTTRSETFDAAGTMISQAVYWDGEVFAETQWDAYDQSDIWYVRNEWNWQDQLTCQNGTYDNGESWVVEWDVGDTEDYQWYRNDHDAGGDLSYQVGVTDEGAWWSVDWDSDSAADFGWIRNDHDSAGDLTYQVGHYDTEAWWAVDWDTEEAETFAWYRNDHDVDGNLTYQVGVNDDGSWWAVDWDTENASDTAWYRNDHDVNGELSFQVGHYDNGSWWAVDWDTDGSQSYSWYRNDHDTAGRLDSQVMVFDDHSYELIDFDQNDDHAWSEHVTVFDASGTQLDDYFL